MMETVTLKDRLAKRRRDERRDLTVHAATVAARARLRPPEPIAAAEPSAEALARAAETVRVAPTRPVILAAPEPIAARWDQLVWSIAHDGHGKSEAFDHGFKACLRALGVDERDIAVLFRVDDES